MSSNSQSSVPIIDMIPPTVSISSPLDSQTISGVQSIVISAQDNNKIHDVSSILPCAKSDYLMACDETLSDRLLMLLKREFI